MRRPGVIIALVGAILVLPAAAMAADPPTLSAVKLPAGMSAPVIDGRVNEEQWMRVEPYSIFTQQDPIEGAPATERTEVRVLFDQAQIYIGVICYDTEPEKIIVSQAKRDSPLTDTDGVILVLDTFNDHQNAFVFGTNPLGIEYDGQVAGEGQTGGVGGPPPPGSASASTTTTRGGISAFNPNWDGDWTVKAQITERGWEAEMAIPLKTLRYAPGPNQTWGFNLWRNIRRKNEQVFLAPIPRGFDIYRVSLAARLTGLSLPHRRDVKVTPYALASANTDYTVGDHSLDRKFEFGGDVKWGVTPALTADFTLNTDFAQVEADDEQVNLTRFDLFFPEKRPFFLENASTFQFGAPQQIDLFFTRRVGLSAANSPIPILGGARVSGKIGHYDVGLLDMQTREVDAPGGAVTGGADNFGVIRVQREVGRSTFGSIFVNRQSTGSNTGSDTYNRAYGADANIQVSSNAKLFSFIARTDSAGSKGSDYSGRVFYTFANNLWQVAGGYSQVGNNFNPEVGFVPRVGYRRPEFRVFFQPQPKRWPWIRRISPHTNYNAYYGFDGRLQSSMEHFHYFEIQPARGGRFGQLLDRFQDRPTVSFIVYNANGRRVIIPPGLYTWYQWGNEFISDPSARFSGLARYRLGGFYDGDYKDIELAGNLRVGSLFTSSLGWTRQRVILPDGSFTATLVPLRVTYSFTTLASIQALIQYNSAATVVTSNIRLALLNRSGTGLFVVYNDRRDTSTLDPHDVLGRSFIVKYTRLVDF